MILRRLILFFFSAFILIICAISTHAQQNFTISGYVKEKGSGENLIGATVAVNETSLGATTNEFGFYSMTLGSGNYSFHVSYLGHEPIDTSFDLNDNIRFNFFLKSSAHEIATVVVVDSSGQNENVQNAQMGKFDLPIDRLKNVPVLFGEQDILKTIQLLPGIQAGTDGSTGFYVRGGGADQNLLLLDGATVYNASHLLGFFSIFNSDAINNVTLYKEGIPAEYGGRLSSVLDITMREGNNTSFHGEGGIGIISSKLTFEGPIVKNKGSFIVSARRTYIDLLLKPFVSGNSQFAGSGYHFYDLNAKLNYTFSDKDRLYLSGYFGQDIFTYSNQDISINIPYGNATATLRWNHLFSNKLFMNASLIYQDYKFHITATQQFFSFTIQSGIRDVNAKADWEWYPGIRHQVKFGADYIHHVFTPNIVSGSSDTVQFQPTGIQQRFAHEAAAYIQDQYDLSDKIQLNGGLRFSLFDQIGPYVSHTYDPFTGQPKDSTVYSSGQSVKTYLGLDPRFLARYKLDENSSLKASFTITHQYIHLVSMSNTTLPTDVWVPSTLLVKPQIAYQYSLGYFRNFLNNEFEGSFEIYYKDLLNQIEYKEGYVPSPNEDLERSFVFGTGDSYGAEFFLNKKTGRLNGWIGYTLSYTNRHFPDLNNGKPFPYRYDRRHDISVVANYQLTDRWILGADFVYSTGIAYTVPVGKYFIEGNVVTEYGALNNVRLPAYNRLDVSATYSGKPHKKFQSGWTFSIYNIYNRQNPFFIYNSYDGVFLQDPKITITTRQVTLFPIIPSVTWNFKF